MERSELSTHFSLSRLHDKTIIFIFFAFQDQEVFDGKTQPQETPQRDYGQHNDHDPKPPSDVLSLDLGTNPEKEATDGQQDQSKLEVSYSCLEHFALTR